MSQDYNSPAFKKLLQKLQEESWQLELLISGFAIFGLFTAFPELEIALKAAESDEKIYALVVIAVALISCAILIFNLLLHVVLRGLWIGALGLRYVSGDIDYDVLNYSEKFSNYLKKKVGSFDRYIGRLENYCSIIFAISFLLIFYVIAFIFTILAIVAIAKLMLDNENLNETLKLWLGIPLMIFIVFGMFLTFLDFITLGWLKKKKWVSRLYFPIYWVFSFITLSFLYRPIVYNFLDNKFGRRISLALVPIYVIIIIGSSLNYRIFNYFERDLNSNAIIANNKNYEDAIAGDVFVEDVMISSKIITENFMKVFMVSHDRFDDYIFSFNPSLKPENDIRGLSSNIVSFDDISWTKRDSLRRSYLEALNKIFTIKIDSIDFESEFIVSENFKQQQGFETYIGIKDLPEGKHLLKVLRKRLQQNDTSTVYEARIPFWYYPN